MLARGELLFDGDGEADPEDSVAEALAAWGQVAAAPLFRDDEFCLWPENEAVFWLWMAVQTQWKVADGVRYALDYQGVLVVMKVRGVRKQDRDSQFSLFQVMENECLTEWARNRR